MNAPAAACVTVVSGLPRSGTSLMMQMLGAGGMRLLVDGKRPPDADNPKGYFEFEPITRLARDASCLEQARGKAVKVIHALLRWLPPEHEYRVILMERSLEEVMASQRKMLERQGRGDAGRGDRELAGTFQRQLEEAKDWLRSQPHFALLCVRYAELVKDPATVVAAVDRFLGRNLDTAAMIAAVDPSLYHQRR